MINRKCVLIYIHIPKCAGSTMLIYLQQYYRIHQVKTWWDKDWKSISPKAQCIFGHFPYGKAERIDRGPYQRITFLRDPVERVISLYYHITWKTVHAENENFSEHTLAELIESRKYAAFDNDMVRFIAGMDRVAFQEPEHPVEEVHLQRAKTNLMEFDDIGFVDTFSLDIVRMANRFGWDDVSYQINIRGRRPKREDLHPDTVKLIEENTLLDTELYNFAKGLNFYE